MPTKLKVANILDPIQPTLDQRVFKGEEPRPRLISYIEKNFFDEMDKFVPDSRRYFDLYLTGSITTYQYGDDSDIDISVIPHYDELAKATGLPDAVAVRKALIKIVIDKLDGKVAPGTPHTLQHFVVPPGTTIHDLFKPGLRSAWSFADRRWVVPPEKERAHDVQRELPGLYLRAENMADKMRVALDTDPATAKRIFMRVHKKRSDDQKRGLGDFSEGNIIYKYLLHEGLFDRIRNELGVYIAKTAATQRLFLAFELPDAVVQQVVDWQAANMPQGVFPEPATNLHMTIAFLGETDDQMIPALRQVLSEIDPNSVTLSGPNEYRELDKLAFLALQDSGGNEIVEQLNERLKELMGYEPQFRPWLPHITVWRFAPDHKPNINPPLPNFGSFSPLAVNVYTSIKNPAGKGGIYQKVAYEIRDRGEKGSRAFIWRNGEVYLGQQHMDIIENNPGLDLHLDYDTIPGKLYMGRVYNDGTVLTWDLGEETPPLNVQNDVLRRARLPEKAASEDRIQVIYDFEKDRIILGIKNSAGLPSTVVLGTYHQADESVTLNETAHQWINAKYFKKLWRTSFPTYPLRVVHFHSKGVHERIGAEAWPIPVNSAENQPSAQDIGYVEAFLYVGEPYNKLYDDGSSEHYELVRTFTEETGITNYDQLEKTPTIMGHIGVYEAIEPEYWTSFEQYIADFQSHTMREFNTSDETLKHNALTQLRKLYPNIRDASGLFGRRWWSQNA